MLDCIRSAGSQQQTGDSEKRTIDDQCLVRRARSGTSSMRLYPDPTAPVSSPARSYGRLHTWLEGRKFPYLDTAAAAQERPGLGQGDRFLQLIGGDERVRELLDVGPTIA